MRIFVLTLGPPVIVAACYWLTMGGYDDQVFSKPSAAKSTTTRGAAESDQRGRDLAAVCRIKAETLREQLSRDCKIIIRSPFILGGDRSEEQLDRYYRLLVLPISHALSTSYCDRAPNEPITILVFSGNRPFQKHARRLDGRSASREYGYYQRDDHRIVLNAATGNGTLAHELTHALTQFDFPHMPVWFDEGLATVHEQCEFSNDRLRLIGLSNWRVQVLIEAINGRRLDSLETFIAKPGIGQRQKALDYAHTRYFCLYLQSRRLLGPYYRKMRRSVDQDPTGAETLRALLQVNSLNEVEADFRQWAMNQVKSKKQKGKS